MVKRHNVNDHRAAAIDLQAEKLARHAAPCVSCCYHAFVVLETMLVICCMFSGDILLSSIAVTDPDL